MTEQQHQEPTKPRSDPQMSKEQINDIIDRKISETRLHITEERFKWFIVIGSLVLLLLGVLPIYQVNELKSDLERRFETLRSQYTPKAELDILFEGASIKGQYLIFDQGSWEKSFTLINRGNGSARNAVFQVFVDDSLGDNLPFQGGNTWYPLNLKLQEYKQSFWMSATPEQILRAGQPFTFGFELPTNLKRGRHRLMNRVLTEELEPKDFAFGVVDQRPPP